MTFNTKRLKVPHLHVTTILTTSESQISFRFAPGKLFSSDRSFWDKCSECPPNYFEHYKVKDTPYT